MRKILIIDDEEDSLFLLKLVLQKSGFEVYTLSTGRTAINAAAELKPDLILLDVKLDGYDGRDICWQLKHNEETKHSKIFLSSAHVTDRRERGYDEDDFIPKPVIVKELVQKINQHFN